MEDTPRHECDEFCEEHAADLVPEPQVITCSGGAVLPPFSAQVPQEVPDGE